MDGVKLSRTVLTLLVLVEPAHAAPAAAAVARGSFQAGVIAGSVVESRSGNPVVGAQITIQGTNRAANTNAEGRFRLDRVTGAEVTLRVVMVGYRAVTRTARVGDEAVRIELTEIPVTIDEVVVTGTPGAAQKRALGNAITRIDAAAVVETQPVSDVGNLLQSRAAGVAVSEQMGVAGGGSRILVRGPGSLSFSGEPIVYVDGIRINNTPNTGPSFDEAGGAGAPSVVSRLNDINPQDIESIEVLKGPAAATLYGTEASAGVIQIITKRGRSGPARFTAQVRQGANWFNDAENRIPVTYGRDFTTGEIVSVNFVKEEAAAGNPLFRTGHVQEYNVGVNGGTDAVRYYSAVEFQRNEGVVPSNTANRFNGRLNLTLRPSSKFDADIGLTTIRDKTSLYHALYLGSFIYGQPAFRNTPSRGFLVAPAEAFRDAFNYNQSVNRTQASVTLSHRPFSWFSHRLSVGQDYTDQSLEILVPVIPLKWQQFFGPIDSRGSKSIDGVRTTYTTADYSATASFNPTKRLGSASSVGFQYYRTYASAQSLAGAQFPAPGVTTISGTAIRSAAEAFVENVTVGLYAQQQFSLNNRFFLTGAIRADDNSAFGAKFDLVTYPKVSASWVISEEPFWHVGFVKGLKLRAAYGQSGQQPASFAAIRTFAPIAGEGDAPAGTPQAPGNPNLGPERGEEIELGFESTMFDDRVGVDFTYYDRKTRDAILQTAVAPSTGFSGTQFINAGEISNKGFEVMVRGRPIAGRDFGWDLSLNLSKNTNRVVDLGIDADFIPTGWIPNRHQEGFPLDAYFRKKVVSAEVQNGIATNAMCDGGTGLQGVEPGGQPVPCAQAPYLYLGKPYYDWNGSLNSIVTLFRRWTLGTVLDFRYGGQMFESINYWNCASLLNHEIDYYPERFSPARVAECQLGLDLVGTSRIQDAGYTKLREVSLNYQVPERIARQFRASRASITLAARNLYTWTGFDGLDPETYTSVNYLLASHTELVLPLPRTFMATINVEF